MRFSLLSRDFAPSAYRRRSLVAEIDEIGLRFGADACLARMTGPPARRRLDLESDRERLIALLSVAAGRPVSVDVLSHVEAAARCWEQGEKALANLRLGFAGLPQLEHSGDAARVELAAYCLDEGLAPRALMRELGLDTGILDMIKYDPNQPRVPAGSGAESGRWTSGAAARALNGAPSLLTESNPEIIAAFAEFAARFSVPTAVLGALIIPTPNSGGVTAGLLPDAPDISFKKDDPAGTLRLATKAADGSDVTVLAHLQRGLYVAADTGSALGRDLGGQLYLDLDAVHDAIDDVTQGSPDAEPDRRPRAASDEPRLCPAPTKDTPHGSSKEAKDYEDDVHARVNPLAPIPRSFGVKVIDPATGNNVFFDDCFRYAGDLVDGDMKPGDLVEAKSTPRDFLYSKGWVMSKDLEQAEKELRAADARGVGLKWYFAEKGAAEIARDVFRRNHLERIVIGHMLPRRKQ